MRKIKSLRLIGFTVLFRPFIIHCILPCCIPDSCSKRYLDIFSSRNNFEIRFATASFTVKLMPPIRRFNSVVLPTYIFYQETAKSLTECLYFDVPRVAKETLDRGEELQKIANSIYQRDDIFYIGRGNDYALSLEASLKLKEISYIHCEAYAAGELKHGTISLIEDGTPVIAISTEKELFSKLDSNIKEVKSRGALTVLICAETEDSEKHADMVFNLPKGSEASRIFGALMAVQMIAYEVSRLRGCDIDKPRNLAKSVTVE